MSQNLLPHSEMYFICCKWFYGNNFLDMGWISYSWGRPHFPFVCDQHFAHHKAGQDSTIAYAVW